MNKQVNSNIASFSKLKRLVFSVLFFIIPFLILFLFECLLRFANYGDDYSLFIQNPIKGFEDYMIVNPLVGKKYFQNFKYTTPANDTFLKKKRKGTFRIFVMGSSTVYGYPYDRNLMFTRILDKRLQETYPDTRIEVINTAISAINSFSLYDLTPDILNFEPDAILIYAGHNEFYGAYGIGSNEGGTRFRKLTQLHFALLHLKLYQLVRNTINKVFARAKSGAESGTLMQHIVKNKQVPINSHTYKTAMLWYKQNMAQILLKIRNKNVPVLLSEVVSNDADLIPFCTNSLTGADSAYNVFIKGKQFYELGNITKARNFFIKARDFDYVRYRASSDVNKIINELAQQYGVKLVPMVNSFEQNSAHGLIGYNLMIDHVHPNIMGQFVMAETFFNALQNGKLIKNNYKNGATGFNEFKSNYGYTELDSLVAIHNINILKSYWPFEHNESMYGWYKRKYHPINYIDSLAFNVAINRDFWLVEARLELANNYKAKGNYYKAFREFNALAQSNPYLAVNYTDAAECLIPMQQYARAKKYLNLSLRFDNSFNTHFTIGMLNLLLSDDDAAIKSFNTAAEQAPTNHQINKYAKTFIFLIQSAKTAYAKDVAYELLTLQMGLKN